MDKLTDEQMIERSNAMLDALSPQQCCEMICTMIRCILEKHDDPMDALNLLENECGVTLNLTPECQEAVDARRSTVN